MSTFAAPGQRIWVVQYGQLHSHHGQGPFGPILVVGTELVCLENAPHYVRVSAPDDSTGWMGP